MAKKLKNIEDNLPAIFQQDANLPTENTNSLGVLALQDMGGFLPSFSFSWGIQGMSKPNFFYLAQGSPDEAESNVQWMDQPFKMTVLFAKDIMRETIEAVDGSISYASAYTKGESQDKFMEMLSEFQAGDKGFQQGLVYCVAIIVDGQVTIAEWTTTKTMYKAVYNTMTNALFRNKGAIEFSEPNCKQILTKSKRGNLFPERARFENHITRSQLTAAEVEAIAGASKANEPLINNWYKK